MSEPSRRRQRRIRDLRRLRGLWRSHGYGILLDIGPERYRLYEETRVSRLFVFEGSLEELAEHYAEVRISPGGRAFSARRSTGVTRVRFRRLARMPRGRAEPDPEVPSDPVHDFEVFWHTFAERYALFDLRGVDWDDAWATHRPRVDARTGERRLFEAFVDMLRPLQDGHTELRASCGRFNAGGPSSLHHRLAAELGRDEPDARVLGLLAERRERSRSLVRERYLGPGTRRSGHGLLEWGRLDEATGYLEVRAMAGQSGRTDRPRQDQQATAAAMDRVLQDLGDLPALVVDVRQNPGGYDGVALRIAGHLTDRRRLAFVKAPSQGHGFGGRQAISVEPRGRRFGGRVFLLTSGLTTSAAEICVLALLQNPRVTRVGEPTHGELSDVMERHLPNGWSFTLSNELYRAADGELYEDRGIPPHVEIPFLHRRDVAAGRDPMLDHVREAMRDSSRGGERPMR